MIILHIIPFIALIAAVFYLNYLDYCDRDIFYDASDSIDDDIFYGVKNVTAENDCFYDADHSTLCFCAEQPLPDTHLLSLKLTPKKHTREKYRKKPAAIALVFKKEYLKRKALDTETDYPSKQARSVPFFSLRPFVYKRKEFEREEESADVVVKRARKRPAVIQLTWVTFIEHLRQLKMIAKVERKLMRRKLNRRSLAYNPFRKAKKRVSFADKVTTVVFCKDDPLIPEPILGKRSADCLDTNSSSPKRVKKRVSFANKVHTIVFCKDDPPAAEPILGKRSADCLDTDSSSPKRVKTRVSFANKVHTVVFCKDDPPTAEPILGKRSSDVLDTDSSSPKRANLAWAPLFITKSVIG